MGDAGHRINPPGVEHAKTLRLEEGDEQNVRGWIYFNKYHLIPIDYT